MENIFKQIIAADPKKIIFSKPAAKDTEYKKIVITRMKAGYQAEKFTQKQVFHDNITEERLMSYCLKTIGAYKQCNAFASGEELMLMLSAKGKTTFKRKKTNVACAQAKEEHNRKKRYIIDAASAAAPLVDMGIFTKEGKVVNSMYDKYRQINRFIEIIDDEASKIAQDEINIIDFGCGKSYLTFVMYYYFTEILKKRVNITGLDLKEDVIKNCNAAAEKYGYANLKFEVGDINGYRTDKRIDMVISLHACDTATDYALYNAVKWGAKYIFSIPCCQHELNAQIKSDNFGILTRYGILKERFSALATDAIRANALEAAGYKTQILEFIDMEHTPKNLLIRAVKSNISEGAKRRAREEIQRLAREFSFEPTLIRLLKVD